MDNLTDMAGETIKLREVSLNNISLTAALGVQIQLLISAGHLGSGLDIADIGGVDVQAGVLGAVDGREGLRVQRGRALGVREVANGGLVARAGGVLGVLVGGGVLAGGAAGEAVVVGQGGPEGRVAVAAGAVVDLADDALVAALPGVGGGLALDVVVSVAGGASVQAADLALQGVRSDGSRGAVTALEGVVGVVHGVLLELVEDVVHRRHGVAASIRSHNASAEAHARDGLSLARAGVGGGEHGGDQVGGHGGGVHRDLDVVPFLGEEWVHVGGGHTQHSEEDGKGEHFEGYRAKLLKVVILQSRWARWRQSSQSRFREFPTHPKRFSSRWKQRERSDCDDNDDNDHHQHITSQGFRLEHCSG